VKYVGIDVGKSKYYAVMFTTTSGTIKKFNRFSEPEELPSEFNPKDTIIAIDAPSGPCLCRHESKKRMCEVELGIGGYFRTPCGEQDARPWMQSGFKLWRFLKSLGFVRVTTKPLKAGNLIEVHPTIVFKKIRLEDKNAGSKSWIGQKDPSSKKTSKGKKERRDILKRKFSKQQSIISGLGIDYMDALISAYTAERLHAGQGAGFGEPEEGMIWFPEK